MSSSRTRVYLFLKLHLGAAVLADEDAVSDLHLEGLDLAVLIALAGARAMTSASWGFSLALSGMMMPPRTCSLSSRCLTRSDHRWV